MMSLVLSGAKFPYPKQEAVASLPVRGLQAEKLSSGKDVQQLRYLQESKTF